MKQLTQLSRSQALLLGVLIVIVGYLSSIRATAAADTYLWRGPDAVSPLVTPIFSSVSPLSPRVGEQKTTTLSASAFPAAEGFGGNSVGGRGGQVIEVTNLNDSGPGSLRAAIDTEGPRIVVFRLGGTIELQSRLEITNPYITIAGQTAPGGGITLKTVPTYKKSAIKIETHDVIIRYIRSRPGPSSDISDSLDALEITGGYNIIIDHSSFSWGTDEVIGIANDARDITIQWSIISEGLANVPDDEDSHGKGLLLGG